MAKTSQKLSYRLIREPMLHFLILGAGIFMAYIVMNGRPEVPKENQLIINEAEVGRLAEQFRATWLRQPTEPELTRLMENKVREEVLVREAEALGMDQNDAVIRQRLRQKMEFLTEIGAQLIAPEDAVLRVFLADNEADYTIDPHLSFEQIYLGDSPTPEQIHTIGAALADGVPANNLGQATMLPSFLPPTPQWSVERTFGDRFVAEIDPSIVDEWQGPVASSFGAHLIRVTSYKAGYVPEFEDVRDRVERDWRAQETLRLKEESYQVLRSRYDVKIPDAGDYLNK
jgi:hypothetical protein